MGSGSGRDLPDTSIHTKMQLSQYGHLGRLSVKPRTSKQLQSYSSNTLYLLSCHVSGASLLRTTVSCDAALYAAAKQRVGYAVRTTRPTALSITHYYPRSAPGSRACGKKPLVTRNRSGSPLDAVDRNEPAEFFALVPASPATVRIVAGPVFPSCGRLLLFPSAFFACLKYGFVMATD